MTIDPSFVAIASILFFGYAVQTVTGFGAGVIYLTLGAHFLGIDELVRLIVPISFLQTGYIAFVHRDGIHWPLLLRRVLPLMMLGMVVAFVFMGGVDSVLLVVVFGLWVLFLSSRELVQATRSDGAEQNRPIGKLGSFVSLVLAGLIHGVYATGGPMLVYAIGREGLSKHVFRSTLCVVWISLNVILVSRFAMAGDYDLDVLKNMLMFVPTVPLGIVVGEWIHRRVDEKLFQIAVYVLLIAAAISLLIRYLPELY